MNKKTLKKVRAELEAIRRSPQGRSYGTLRSLAKDVGRALSDRGKEPTWVRQIDPALSPPLSIPNHKGDVPVGTARSIVQQLMDDCDDWEVYLLRNDDENDDDSDAAEAEGD